MSLSLAATEETGASPIGTFGAEASEEKDQPRGFLKAARKDLTAEQAGSEAGVRWLQYEAERLEKECSATRSEIAGVRRDYKEISEKYNDQRVEMETLKGKQGIAKKNEILSTLSLGVGCAGLGVAPTYLSVPAVAGMAYSMMVICAVLVVGSIVCRMWK